VPQYPIAGDATVMDDDDINNNNNNNNNTNICKAHIVSIRAESEPPAVDRWRGWIVVVV